MKRWAIVGLLAFLPSHASALTGVQLYDFCIKDTPKQVGDLTCASYIRGFIDGMVIGSVNEVQGKFCPPKGGISVEQARLIAEKYMKDHLEQLNLEAGLMVGVALLQAFRCGPN